MRAVQEYLANLEQLPAGTLAPVAGLVAEIRLRLGVAGDNTAAQPESAAGVVPLTWRERLWLVPPETRLGVVELAEALGRPRSWVYRRTGPASEHAPLPCRKLDGELVFIVGEIRVWMSTHETIVNEPEPAIVLPIRRRNQPGDALADRGPKRRKSA